VFKQQLNSLNAVLAYVSRLSYITIILSLVASLSILGSSLGYLHAAPDIENYYNLDTEPEEERPKTEIEYLTTELTHQPLSVWSFVKETSGRSPILLYTSPLLNHHLDPPEQV
jgi:hypothetical protein